MGEIAILSIVRNLNFGRLEISLTHQIFRGPGNMAGPLEIAFIYCISYILIHERSGRPTVLALTGDLTEYEIVSN